MHILHMLFVSVMPVVFHKDCMTSSVTLKYVCPGVDVLYKLKAWELLLQLRDVLWHHATCFVIPYHQLLLGITL